MNIRRAKLLKVLGLLVSSLFIATVSASVYSYMYIQGTGQVTTTGLQWQEGPDAPSGTTINGGTVSNLALTTNEGSKRNYTDCLRIVNLDAAEDHAFTIEVTASTGDKGNFTEFNLVLFDNSSVQQAVLDLETLGSNATGLTIPQGVTWKVLFELIPISSPTTGATVTFEVTLTYESAA